MHIWTCWIKKKSLIVGTSLAISWNCIFLIWSRLVDFIFYKICVILETSLITTRWSSNKEEGPVSSQPSPLIWWTSDQNAKQITSSQEAGQPRQPLKLRNTGKWTVSYRNWNPIQVSACQRKGNPLHARIQKSFPWGDPTVLQFSGGGEVGVPRHTFWRNLIM